MKTVKSLTLALSMVTATHVLATDDIVPPAVAQKIEQSAQEKATFSEEVKENLEKKGKVLGIREIPANTFYFVEAEHGSYVVSQNGRFVMDGRLVDVWHRKTVKTLSDAEELARVPVSNIGFKPEKQLFSFQVGDPTLPRSGVAFVDPGSEYTKVLLKHLTENQDKYNFTISLMPLIGGQKAEHRARALGCAIDQDKALQDLIDGTELSYEQTKDNCPDTKIALAKYVQTLMNIENLPHIIREDGLVSEGVPTDFEAWFTQP
ncbi:MAG: hypothetical protein GJ680_19150 [Alteromonadaceae bacterium]|nr:hypothetical protein [Alteromonadaceae bacterium]